MKSLSHAIIPEILSAVALAMGLTVDQIVASGRHAYSIAWARQMTAALLFEHAHISLSEIARTLGYKDHKSCTHAVELVKDCFVLPDPVSRSRRRMYFQTSIQIQTKIENLWT